MHIIFVYGGIMKVELLAPGGSYETVITAMNAGADAVYTGGEKFGARAFANNLSLDELKSALIRGEVDFALGNFDYSKMNMKYDLTTSIADLNYVILSKKDYLMNSIKGLQSQKVSTVNGSKLYQLCKENSVKTISYDNTDELLRNIDDNSIIESDR